MTMSCTSKPVFKSLSIPNGCLVSVPAIFTSKTSSYSHLSTPSKPTKLRLSCSLSSSILSSSFPNRRTHSSTIVAFVAQTSNRAQQEEPTWENREIDEIEEESNPETLEEAKIFVGNLPDDVDSEKLAQLFGQAGVVEIAEVIYNRETGRSRRFGFVTMSTVEEADKTVEMFHSYDINRRALTVNKAAPRGSRPEHPAPVLEPAHRIYVANLPWDVDNSRLERIFSEHGKVVDAWVVYDRETSRSRGFGFVAMSTEAELNHAISNLNGQNLGGRTIRVDVAQERPRHNSF